MEEKETRLVSKRRELKKKINKEYMILGIIVMTIILIDQICKLCVSGSEGITVIQNVLNFNIQQNTNPAYGIGSNSTFMYIITNFVILGVIFKFVTTQNEFVDMKLKTFLTLIFAGGLSNVIDRIFRGYVLEFIDFTPIVRLPIFNVADICILVGWVSVAAIFAVFTVNEWRNTKVKKGMKEEKEKDKENK